MSTAQEARGIVRRDFEQNLGTRHARGTRWRIVFMLSTIFAIVFLATLIITVVNDAFGYVVMLDEVDTSTLARNGVALEDQDKALLLETLSEHLAPRRYRALERELPFEERDALGLYEVALSEIVKPQVVQTYTLIESLFGKKAILEQSLADYPDGELIFRSWVSMRFLSTSLTGRPLSTGVLTAIKGTLLTIMITVLFAFPIGIAAAIWLEEYASDNRLNRIIQ
jgi:phosphate transport system permease protein